MDRLDELKESYLKHVRTHGEITFGVNEVLGIAYDLRRDKADLIACLRDVLLQYAQAMKVAYNRDIGEDGNSYVKEARAVLAKMEGQETR